MFLGLPRAARDKLGDAAGVARFFQIVVVVRRHHRHREQLERALRRALARRRHRLREGVDGEKVDAEPGDLPGRALNGDADVVELQIEKDALLRGLQFACEIEAAGA